MSHNKKINMALATATLSIVLSLVLALGVFKPRKIAYVHSTELVYGYLGMKEAQNEFQKKSQLWSMNIDTLQKDYQLAFSRYAAEVSTLSEKEKVEREHLLREQQQNLMTYNKSINEQAKKEDDKMTQSVLNQVNSFVNEYGEKNGYDIILGTTESGNLLYGKASFDITKQVLNALNTNYKPGQITASNEQ